MKNGALDRMHVSVGAPRHPQKTRRCDGLAHRDWTVDEKAETQASSATAAALLAGQRGSYIEARAVSARQGTLQRIAGSFSMQYTQAPFRDIEEFFFWLDDTLQRPPFSTLCGALLTATINPAGRLISGRMMFSDKPITPRCGPTYRDLRLREEWIGRSEAVERLRQIIAGNGNVAGESISKDFRNPDARFIVGPISSESGWSEWHVTLTSTADGNTPESNNSLVAYGAPLFFSVGHAVSEFVFQQSRPWQPGYRPDFGRLHVIMPDLRIKLAARWERSKDRLLVVLDGDVAWEETEIQILANSSPAFRRHCVGGPGTHDFPIPPDADLILITVAHRCGEPLAVVDLRPPFLLSVGFDEEPTSPDEGAIQRELSGGESDRVEFKPFIRSNDQKEMEIVETVIAFANSGGGRIYVGVDRYGRPESENSVHKAGFSEPDAYDKVRRRIYQLIEDRSKPVPPFEADVIAVKGANLVRLQVQRGPNPPYSTHNNDIFIRKGATNQKPDPHTEMPSPPDDVFGR